MATVSRSQVTRPPVRSPQKNGALVARQPARVVRTAAVTTVRRMLPTTPTEVVHDINEYSFLVHGKRKIGKTSLSVAEDNVFLMTFDPKQISRPIIQEHLTTWSQFEDFLGMMEDAVKAGTYPYTRAVIDGAGMWARCGERYIAKTKFGIDDWDDIPDEAYGSQYNMLTSLLERATNRLLALPGRCWFICHSEWKQVKTRRGDKIDSLIPALSKRGDNVLVGMTDFQGAYDYDGKERILIIEGDENITAGHRIEGHFRTPDNRNVAEIPMGGDEFEAWENIKNAFNNKQPFITLVERDQQIAQRRKAVPVNRTLPTKK